MREDEKRGMRASGWAWVGSERSLVWKDFVCGSTREGCLDFGEERRRLLEKEMAGLRYYY